MMTSLDSLICLNLAIQYNIIVMRLPILVEQTGRFRHRRQYRAIASPAFNTTVGN